MLVTHTINILPQVDNIVFLVDGSISEIGSYQELLQRNGAFAEFLHSHITAEEQAGTGFPGNPNELESFFLCLSVNCFLNIILTIKEVAGEGAAAVHSWEEGKEKTTGKASLKFVLLRTFKAKIQSR